METIVGRKNATGRKKKNATRRKKKTPPKLPLEELDAGQNQLVDRISELPEGILISIISKLSLKEATATSVLSTRWRHLHIYTCRLNFPTFEPLRKTSSKRYLQKILNKKFPDHIKMINRILDSNKCGHFLKEFSVQMPCFVGANVERWLEFALAREVEIVDINMVRYREIDKIATYTFPPLSNIVIKNCGASLKSLKDLSLCSVDVGDREFELLLSNFTALEHLLIKQSRSLVNVLVSGHPLLKLKHLSITHSWNLKSLEVRDAINLVSLNCYELVPLNVMQLNNVPRLIDLNISDRGQIFLEKMTGISSSIHTQLEHLKLLTYLCICKAYRWAEMLPKFTNVRHLQVDIRMARTTTLQLRTLFEACPLLEKLEMKFLWSLPDANSNLKDDRKPSEFLVKRERLHLKRVTFSGYLGCPTELEFVWYIINEKAVALEELTVEPCDLTPKIRQQATARAWEHFPPITPKSVILVIT